jgi:thiol-disulfide isomerase/thioredoxin
MKYISYFLLLLISCSPTEKKEQSIRLSDIQLSDLEGNRVVLEDDPSTAVFINFWATWCRPCLAEMPSIDRLQSKLANEEIAFIFASDEEPERIKQFMAERNMKGRFLRIENPEALNIMALPTTFIFNEKGELVFSEAGYRQWDQPDAVALVLEYINQ